MNFLKKFTASVLLFLASAPFVLGLGSTALPSGGIGSLEDDPTPTLSNDLDLNGNGIIFPGATVTDVTGEDMTLVSGTAGTSGHIASWNVDGDLVDGTLVVANIIDTSDAATTSVAGISELATSGEVTTGTDNTRTITPLALAGSDIGQRVLSVMVLDVTESCTTGDGAGDVFFRVPSVLNGWNLVGVGFGVDTAGTTGNFDVQIRNATQTADMLSTKMRVETGETDTITSAQPGTIDTNNDDVATGDKLYFDADACQTTPALGGFANLTFQKP